MTGIASRSNLSSALSLFRESQMERQKLLGQVGSGKQVNSAGDNAAYWSIATTMGSHGRALAAASDTIGLSQAMADVTLMGLTSATGIVSEIRSKIILAASLTNGRGAINDEISQLKEQLKTVAGASGFGGQNWLQISTPETPPVKSLVASVSGGPDGAPIKTIDFATDGVLLISRNDAGDGLLTRSTTVTTKPGNTHDFHLLYAGSATPAPSTEIAVSDSSSMDELTGMIMAMDNILGGLTDASDRTGATLVRLETQDTYLRDLQDSIARGMGRLVDGNLEEDAVKLRSLEIREQLKLVVLNITNAQAQSVLSFFR